MTVPEQTTERRYCVTHEGTPYKDSDVACGDFTWLGELHPRGCVPAVLVLVSQREAEQKVIDAAVLWRSLISGPNPTTAEVGAMQRLEWATSAYELLTALAVQGDTDEPCREAPLCEWGAKEPARTVHRVHVGGDAHSGQAVCHDCPWQTERGDRAYVAAARAHNGSRVQGDTDTTTEGS